MNDTSLEPLVALAKRAGFLEAVRHCPALTVEQLCQLYQRCGGTHSLGPISLRQLVLPYARWSDAELAQQIRDFYRLNPTAECSAAEFGRMFEIRRWRAQRLMGELEAAGFLERRGTTSTTRFSLRTPASVPRRIEPRHVPDRMIGHRHARPLGSGRPQPVMV